MVVGIERQMSDVAKAETAIAELSLENTLGGPEL